MGPAGAHAFCRAIFYSDNFFRPAVTSAVTLSISLCFLVHIENVSLFYDREITGKVDFIFGSDMTWSRHVELVASDVSKRCML